jgi:endonuclease/exonuclease/phosphatase family metal-dependent hydrolase
MQAQVRQLCAFVAGVASSRQVTVLCGDFNAGPDSDGIRMLTGRSATAAPGLVFYDAWEVAGDGTAGVTWSNRSRMLPSRKVLRLRHLPASSAPYPGRACDPASAPSRPVWAGFFLSVR